jgi:hypothetical protein
MTVKNITEKYLGSDLFKIIETLILNPMNLLKNIEAERQRTLHLSNRFVTKSRTDKSNESILLELSMPTYDQFILILKENDQCPGSWTEAHASLSPLSPTPRQWDGSGYSPPG